jgi:hypothetical protein
LRRNCEALPEESNVTMYPRMTTIMPPPPEDAPYQVRLGYYRGLASFPMHLAAASSLIAWGAAWLFEHGEISKSEFDKLMERSRRAEADELRRSQRGPQAPLPEFTPTEVTTPDIGKEIRDGRWCGTLDFVRKRKRQRRPRS